MAKITGIRSVDFVIKASGEGVVNHNGAISVYNPAAEKYVDNHMFPKLRGIDPMRKAAHPSDAEKTRGLSLADPELAKATLIVSSGCMRSNIFKGASFGISSVTRDTVGDVLASLHGLMRGYLVTDGGGNFARKSPLHLTELECAKPGLRYNQGSKAGERTGSSIFSYFTTDKNLQYVGHGSISIEDLQFIPLENSLGRSSFSEVVSEEVGLLLAGHVTQYLQDISGSEAPKAEFILNAVRRNSIGKTGEAGLLLNEAAIDVLVHETLDLIKNLYIRQSKGFLRVDEVSVDYNDGQAMRIERSLELAVPEKTQPYAVYFESSGMTSQGFAEKMAALEEKSKAAADKTKATKKAKADKAQAKSAAEA